VKYIWQLLKIIVLGFLSLGCIFLIGLVILRLLFPEWYIWKPYKESLNGVRCLAIEDEFQYFQEYSEFNLPPNAEIILSCDDHSSFHWDGEYYIVFDTTEKYINFYLETTPWRKNWKRGPVPDRIASITALSDEFPEIYNSREVWYVAQDRSQNRDQTKESYFYNGFFNGRLIVIDPKNNRVFYSHWDS